MERIGEKWKEIVEKLTGDIFGEIPRVVPRGILMSIPEEDPGKIRGRNQVG